LDQPLSKDLNQSQSYLSCSKGVFLLTNTSVWYHCVEVHSCPKWCLLKLTTTLFTRIFVFEYAFNLTLRLRFYTGIPIASRSSRNENIYYPPYHFQLLKLKDSYLKAWSNAAIYLSSSLLAEFTYSSWNLFRHYRLAFLANTLDWFICESGKWCWTPKHVELFCNPRALL
jgi:hypothetical protein